MTEAKKNNSKPVAKDSVLTGVCRKYMEHSWMTEAERRIAITRIIEVLRDRRSSNEINVKLSAYIHWRIRTAVKGRQIKGPHNSK